MRFKTIPVCFCFFQWGSVCFYCGLVVVLWRDTIVSRPGTLVSRPEMMVSGPETTDSDSIKEFRKGHLQAVCDANLDKIR